MNDNAEDTAIWGISGRMKTMRRVSVMFLLRAAFWLLIVLAFLPIDRPDIESRLPVSTGEALNAARSTFIDLAGFCDRNPDACKTGAETARLIGERAQTGAMAVYRYFTSDDASVDDLARDTLRASDRIPEWIGPGEDASRS